MVDLKPQKRRKVAEVQNSIDGLDRLSSLGDNLLTHILFFLYTESAVATSVLSKRWKLVWTGTPVVALCCWPKDENSCFPGFVDRVLRMNNVLCLKKLTFSRLFYFDLVQVTSWIANLTMRHIEEVTLQFSPDMDQAHGNLMVMLLKSVQPLILRLERSDIPSKILFPTLSVQFSNLKILYLSYMNIYECRPPNDAFMNNLLASCPVLEEIHIRYYRWHCLHIVSSTLKHLDINTEGDSLSKLVVEAPVLEQLQISGFGMYDYQAFDVMKCLVETNIDFQRVSLGLLEAICCTKTLHISTRPFDDLFSSKTAFLDHQLKFNNLTLLDLEVAHGGLHIMPGLLKCCPNLESLFFHMDVFCNGGVPQNDVYNNWIPPPDIPRCLFSCLKSIAVLLPVNVERGHVESDDCLVMIGYLLEYSRVLKEMKVTAKRLDSEREAKVLKKLSMFPKTSASCEVIFISKAE